MMNMGGKEKEEKEKKQNSVLWCACLIFSGLIGLSDLVCRRVFVFLKKTKSTLQLLPPPAQTHSSSETLQYVEDYPQPSALPDQVVVQIKFAAINPCDFKLRRVDVPNAMPRMVADWLFPKPKISSEDLSGLGKPFQRPFFFLPFRSAFLLIIPCGHSTRFKPFVGGKKQLLLTLFVDTVHIYINVCAQLSRWDRLLQNLASETAWQECFLLFTRGGARWRNTPQSKRTQSPSFPTELASSTRLPCL